MSFLSSLAKIAGGESTDDSKKAAGGESGSPTELFTSAKVLAEAAQGQFNKDSSSAPVDNKKVAEAAADVLDAAQKYGKLDNTQGIGQYVEKAETYLHQYGAGSAPPPAAAEEKPPAAEPEETKAPAPESEQAAAPEETKAPAPESEPAVVPVSAPAAISASAPPPAADYLGYAKMAGDLFSKK